MADKPQKKPEQKKDEKPPAADAPANAEGSDAKINALEREIANLNSRIAEGKEQNARLQERANAGDLVTHALHKVRREDETPEQALVRVLKERDELKEQVKETQQVLERDLKTLNEERDSAVSLREQLAALRKDFEVLAKAARHGEPPEAFQPTTEEGKAALKEVVLLGNIAKSQREANVRAMPESGWSSPRAWELVAAVPAEQRALLLGDLLVQLAPHAGETGANETASDVLRRKLADLEVSQNALKTAQAGALLTTSRNEHLTSQVARLQAAMVARRAPDAVAEVMLGQFQQLLEGPAVLLGHPASEFPMALVLEQVISEWRGLRGFLSAQPLVAVAVRDDSTPELSERYALLLLEWSGKALAVSTVERRLPWGDIAPRMRSIISTRLIPAPFRE